MSLQINSSTVGGAASNTALTRQNAVNTGALARTGAEVTKKSETDSTATTVGAAPQQESPAPALLPGIKSTPTAEGEVTTAENGLAFNVSGEKFSLSLPGGEVITGDVDGAKIDGGPKVTPHETDGITDGFSFERKDGTDVFVHLPDMSVSYQSPDGSVLQGVDSTGQHWIKTASSFKDKDGKLQTLENEFFLDADGTIHADRDQGLKVGKNGFSFQDPNGNWIDKEYVVPFEGTPQGPLAGSKPSLELPKPDIKFEPKGGSLLNDMHSQDLTVNGTTIPNPNPVEFNDCTSASGLQRRTTADGHVFSQLRNGVSVVDTPDGGAFAFDAREGAEGTRKDVTVSQHNNEKQFQFPDKDGNVYTMFSNSQDVLVESKDGRVGQILLPSGNMFVGVRGDDRAYRVEVAPNGEAKAEKGVDLVRNATGDITGVAVPIGGKMTPIALPLPVDQDFRASALAPGWNGSGEAPVSHVIPDVIKQAMGNYEGPESSAASKNAPPPLPPPLPPSANGFGDIPEREGGLCPTPGQIQEPVHPSLWQRMKYAFTGDPASLGTAPASFQPRCGRPVPPDRCPPPWGYDMPPYPGHHYQQDPAAGTYGMMKAMYAAQCVSTLGTGIMAMLSCFSPFGMGMFYSPMMML